MDSAKEVAGLPGLMKTSAKQLHKVPALTRTAILTALNVVVDILFIPITPTFRIGFSSIPTAVCGIYYGPIYTGFADAIADTLKYIIRPDSSYFPGFVVSEFLAGVIYGCFFYKEKITLPGAIIVRTCITVFTNLVLISLWLNVIYQSPLFTMTWLIKNVMMFPVDVVLLYAALKGAERVHGTWPCNIEKGL